MAGMTLNVDEGLVQPIIEAEIQAAIVRQLESAQNLIPKLVQAALNQKVNAEGKVTSSSYDSKYSYIEVLCNQAIQKAAQEGMKKYIEDSLPIIQAEVEKQIRSQTRNIAKTFVEGLAESIKTEWRFSVTVKLPEQN
jgi:polyribonucleotide nucleotidyltransferase